ncbi:MAG: choloylglycine hydrolase family protein [Ruminococcaceae bacterium]|nr:choloylglycine hydrolase family protein [Oscillospiraceae bacterium]
MCTAVSYKDKIHLFGRNLDVDYSYGQKIIVVPRKYEINFKHFKTIKKHFSIIGAGITDSGYPLLFDGINEKGLGIAALRFAGTKYNQKMNCDNIINLASYELILYLLSVCKNASQAAQEAKNINITSDAFSKEMPSSPLHWMISDCESSYVIECENEKTNIYENSVGVLTNMPRFDIQLFNLNNYMNISPFNPTNKLAPKLSLEAYSYGLGAMGLPGDLSSMSRFVKATYTKFNSACANTESENIAQFFHILNSVCQQKGCTHTAENKYEYTAYSSCCDTKNGIYYYTTYNNGRICGVNMNNTDLDSSNLTQIAMDDSQNIFWQN